MKKYDLHELLTIASKEEFLKLLWCSYIAQTKYYKNSIIFFDKSSFPKDFINNNRDSHYRIHEWEIETLANEIITTDYSPLLWKENFYKLKTSNARSIFECVNSLRKLENEEYKKISLKDSREVYSEIRRTGQRQFKWQTGYNTIEQYYRNIFIYGDQKCSDIFHKKYNISIQKFSKIGFMMYVHFLSSIEININTDYSEFDIDQNEFDIFISIISRKYDEISEYTRNIRNIQVQTSYKPSFLRRYPCIELANGNLVCPIPDLIIERTTSGLFYDLVDSDISRTEYGKKFEDYCYSLINIGIPDIEISREEEYGSKKRKYNSPDIIIKNNNIVELVCECKSSRITYESKFGYNPLSDRGFQDIVKAVFQIWRYFSHLRKGYSNNSCSDDAIGVIFTTDDWLTLGDYMYNSIFQMAEDIIKEKKESIDEIDKRKIVFISALDLENSLFLSNKNYYINAMKEASKDKFRGYLFSTVCRELYPDFIAENIYPFKSEAENIITWMKDFT